MTKLIGLFRSANACVLALAVLFSSTSIHLSTHAAQHAIQDIPPRASETARVYDGKFQALELSSPCQLCLIAQTTTVSLPSFQSFSFLKTSESIGEAAPISRGERILQGLPSTRGPPAFPLV